VTEKFIFWAQALDNASPDHIEMEGEELSPDDTRRRQDAVSRVNRVCKTGKTIFNQHGVQLTADRQHFVIEVPSAERDRAGRIAPIVCYGDYNDSTVGDALGASVAVALDDFAKRIGRNILPEHFDLVRASIERLCGRRLARNILPEHFDRVRQAFAEVKRKCSMVKRRRAVAIGVAALVVVLALVLALACWLVWRGEEDMARGVVHRLLSATRSTPARLSLEDLAAGRSSR
jgi:hypothetical protein